MQQRMPSCVAQRSVGFELVNCLEESSQFHLSMEDVSDPPGAFRPVSPARSELEEEDEEEEAELRAAALEFSHSDASSQRPSSPDCRLRSRSVPIFQEMSPEDRINRVAIGLRDIGDEITRTRQLTANGRHRDRVHSVSWSYRAEVTETRARRLSLRHPDHPGSREVGGVSSWPAVGGDGDGRILRFVARMFRTLSGADIDYLPDGEVDRQRPPTPPGGERSGF